MDLNPDLTNSKDIHVCKDKVVSPHTIFIYSYNNLGTVDYY